MTATIEAATPARTGLCVLVIEDDPDEADCIEQTLRAAEIEGLSIELVDRLFAGLDRLGRGGVDVCLLDLWLPDSTGTRSVLAARAQAPHVPVLVLAATGDDVAERALGEGAAALVMKESLDPAGLARSIRSAIEKSKASGRRNGAAPRDPLTGLLGLEGLRTFGVEHVRLATAARRPFALIYAHVDGLRRINEERGWKGGNQLLLETAGLLTSTFRASDVVSRVGGDEFGILLTEVTVDPPGEDRACERLEAALEELNAGRATRRRLELSIEAVRFEPADPCSIDELLDRGRVGVQDRKRRAA